MHKHWASSKSTKLTTAISRVNSHWFISRCKLVGMDSFSSMGGCSLSRSTFIINTVSFIPCLRFYSQPVMGVISLMRTLWSISREEVSLVHPELLWLRIKLVNLSPSYKSRLCSGQKSKVKLVGNMSASFKWIHWWLSFTLTLCLLNKMYNYLRAKHNITYTECLLSG